MFQDVLPQDEEEDEDDIEAHEASIQRLKVTSWLPPFAIYINIDNLHILRKPTMQHAK